MKLFFTETSPYARRSRIAIRESGLLGQVEEIDVTPLSKNTDIMLQYGPGAKVPGLVTGNGVFVCETLLIGFYLNEVSGGKLYPEEPLARDLAFQIDGIASLLMESLFYRSHEKRREDGEKSPAVIDKEADRAGRAYNALEGLVDRFRDIICMGQITTVSSLGYADWRHPEDSWRDGRPKLARWFEKAMERPAMVETKPEL